MYGIIGWIFIFGSLLRLISLESSIDVEEKNKLMAVIVMAQLSLLQLSKFFICLCIHIFCWLCLNRTDFHLLFNLDFFNLETLSMGKEGEMMKKLDCFRYSKAFLIYPVVLSIAIASIEYSSQPNVLTPPSMSFDPEMFSNVLNDPLIISLMFILLFPFGKNFNFNFR